MREFDFADFDGGEEEESATEEAEEGKSSDDEFEPVIIDIARLNPDGVAAESTFTELAADEMAKQFERRDAHIKIFTSQFKIVGKILVPAEGAQTRLTDTLNAPGKVFLPITEAEVTSLKTGKVIQSGENTFVVVNRDDIQVILPISEPAKPTAKIDFAKESFAE
ncbi:hypothetical protein J7M28_01470 [bacterium]|nr:hypothetical protein [bacterium]